MTVIHPPVHTDAQYVAPAPLSSPRAILNEQQHPTETDAVNALVDMQRANSEAIDPNGARRLVRSLVALGLLRFE